MTSLQDQLLKAGIVDKNKAKKIKNNQHKQAKVMRQMGNKIADQLKATVSDEQAKKLARDKQLNQLKQQKASQKALLAQIKQLINLNKINRDKGDIHYSFVHQNKVKHIYVTPELRRDLSQGKLAIVLLVDANNDKFEIVPTAIAEKIAKRDDRYIIQLDVQENQVKTDNAYADYPIPDDLMW